MARASKAWISLLVSIQIKISKYYAHKLVMIPSVLKDFLFERSSVIQVRNSGAACNLSIPALILIA